MNNAVIPPSVLNSGETTDLVCFSHLRWDFVFQRPQHLLTRLAKRYRVFFFEEPVVGASQQQVMPAFGMNSNVMCYLDDMYIYLRARGADALGRVRPAKREPKPESFDKAEATCLGPEKN